jgi:hypothetical protein
MGRKMIGAARLRSADKPRPTTVSVRFRLDMANLSESVISSALWGKLGSSNVNWRSIKLPTVINPIPASGQHSASFQPV